MLPNDDLARFGEPPTDEQELALADLLAEVLERDPDEPLPHATLLRAETTRGASSLLEVCRWIDEMIGTVLDRSGVLENLPPPADAGGSTQRILLRLSVSRLVGGVWQAVASTHPGPCVVRDLRRIPDNANRVHLRTGERVRIEIVPDRAGHMLVFNVGPRGTVNVLYPAYPSESGLLREHEPLHLVDVEMTLPAGRERVYAVWSQAPLSRERVQLRDMQRVQQTLSQLRPEDWHAVLLELDHQA